jgi:hypothetical protein
MSSRPLYVRPSHDTLSRALPRLPHRQYSRAQITDVHALAADELQEAETAGTPPGDLMPDRLV